MRRVRATSGSTPGHSEFLPSALGMGLEMLNPRLAL